MAFIKPGTPQKSNNTPSYETTDAIPKKPFRTPLLKVYGDIQSLTKSISNRGGQLDGHAGAMSKTA
jgi:hypothetical protein